jgi:hypothetical protein
LVDGSRRIPRWKLLGACVAAALLSACGGGDSAPSTAAAQVSPTPTVPSAASAAITGFAPTAGAPGSVVNVSGASLSAVTSARVGGVDATFRAPSDTTLEVTVPASARTGRIELNAAGRVLLSETDFTVMSIPAVSSVAPTTLLPPGRITLTGTTLDLVREVRLNALVLTIATRTPTALAVDVPSGAMSGTLTLVDTAGVARPLAQLITIAGPVTMSSFSPASIVTGQTLTVNGTNLDRATSLVFANGSTATIAARTGTTRLTAVVPDAATSGVFRVRADAGDEAQSAAPLQVIPAVRVDANAVYRVAAAGNSVTITGTGHRAATVRVGRPLQRLFQARPSWSLPRPPVCLAVRSRSSRRRSRPWRAAASSSGRAASQRWPASSSRRSFRKGLRTPGFGWYRPRRPGCVPSSCRRNRMCRRRSFG